MRRCTTGFSGIFTGVVVLLMGLAHVNVGRIAYYTGRPFFVSFFESEPSTISLGIALHYSSCMAKC